MNLTLKYKKLPSVISETSETSGPSGPSGPMYSFINKENKKPIDATDKTQIIGSLAAVAYMLLFSYIYGSAIYQGKFFHTDGTLSQAFRLCEKRGTIILMLCMLCLLQLLFSSQNITLADNDIRKIFVIIFTFIIVATWFLLFFIWPKEAKIHSLVSFITLCSTTIFTIIIYDLYNSYYQKEGLLALNIASWISASFLILVVVIGAILWIMSIFKYKGTVPKYISKLFSITEVLAMFIFGVYLFIFALLPALPNKDDVECYMKN